MSSVEFMISVEYYTMVLRECQVRIKMSLSSNQDRKKKRYGSEISQIIYVFVYAFLQGQPSFCCLSFGVPVRQLNNPLVYLFSLLEHFKRHYSFESVDCLSPSPHFGLLNNADNHRQPWIIVTLLAG